MAKDIEFDDVLIAEARGMAKELALKNNELRIEEYFGIINLNSGTFRLF